ncbi:hypothetical protein GXM_04531 [Nostoc sphaeroides CCNUC1]|uniref:Uncharacterized protein n=1 Tax=Nostoc sphaeroides CCNUC1 TaxID=2653204 RepID=A0A5P8W337_9NOSO|nr:hypothetical protein GXM_04531 [Nostoc sphaeroides CCNUC1]
MSLRSPLAFPLAQPKKRRVRNQSAVKQFACGVGIASLFYETLCEHLQLT